MRTPTPVRSCGQLPASRRGRSRRLAARGRIAVIEKATADSSLRARAHLSTFAHLREAHEPAQNEGRAVDAGVDGGGHSETGGVESEEGKGLKRPRMSGLEREREREVTDGGPPSAALRRALASLFISSRSPASFRRAHLDAIAPTHLRAASALSFYTRTSARASRKARPPCRGT